MTDNSRRRVNGTECILCMECVKSCPKEMCIRDRDNTVKGSQFKQPVLEFSGSCAGCAETSYARLVTQLFGDQMCIRDRKNASHFVRGFLRLNHFAQ